MKTMNKAYKYFLITLLSVAWLAGATAQGGSPAKTLQTADSMFFAQNWKEAKQDYTRYLTDTSTNSLAWNRLGYCNQNLGLYDDALNDYQKSLANNPSPPVRGVASAR